MKTKIDIVTGFLSSGKTSIINEILKNLIESKERIVLIQCEHGEEVIKKNIINNKDIIVEKMPKNQNIDESYIIELVKKYSKHRIVIEQNGMANIEELLDILTQKKIRKFCIINEVINIIDCRQFYMLMGIIGSNIRTKIIYSDVIVLNYSDKVPIDEIKKIKDEIRNINKLGKIIEIEKPKDFLVYKNEELLNKSSMDRLSLFFLGFIMIYLTINVMKGTNFNKYISKIQVLNTVFISILMEAFPFLLLGVIISSIIQLFVTREIIVKYFPKTNIGSFFVAIIGGLFFPVCDCAIVPVTSSLVKKGVPLHIAVTFMLSAPIINPIVIVSTYYAFGPIVALTRVGLGIIVAVITGILFLVFPEKEEVFTKVIFNENCNCIYCNGYSNNKSRFSKISSIFKHVGEEFFSVGKYLIIGAFITAIVQICIPKSIFAEITDFEIVSIIIMMLLAFLFSVCSSSDAFIARSFSNQFPMSAIMGFMILGAMVDIKNLLMLSEGFSKRFVIKLLFIVWNVTFAIICFYHTIF